MPGVLLGGEADHRRKVALLQQARALLCPIQWEEPFGLIAIEAMLTGTPVIGFARGAFPEIIDDGVTGILVSDVQEMTRAIALASHLDRKAVRRAGQRKVLGRTDGGRTTNGFSNRSCGGEARPCSLGSRLPLAKAA